MSAFNQVPLHMRERLAIQTSDQTRLIGGSADTMYIPGYLRDVFLDTLDLFLGTDCFLEIALPTVAHLILPPGEKIVFVDHVRRLLPSLHCSIQRVLTVPGR